MIGSKPLQPAAYSEKTGLLYFAGNKKCMMLAAQDLKDEQGSSDVFGMSVVTNFYYYPHDRYEPDYGGFLKAWDPKTADYKWVLPETYAANSGVLTTKGGLTFYATLDGFFRAVDASSGGNLYTYKMPMKAMGNISTWMYQGHQYIGILVGAYPNADKAWVYKCGSELTDGYRSDEQAKYEVVSSKNLCHQPDGGAYLIFSLKRH
jgi:glucose dehydrogenase